MLRWKRLGGGGLRRCLADEMQGRFRLGVYLAVNTGLG